MIRVNSGFHPGEPRRAKRRRFLDLGPVHGGSDDVAQKLHRPVTGRHAAVDTKDTFHVAGRIGPHGLKQITGLVAHGLKSGPRKLVRTRITGQPENRTATFRLPIGRTQSGEGGDQNDRLCLIRLFGHALRLTRFAYDFQAIAQPLDNGTGNKD